MSGMGAEEVYKETLTIAGKEGAQVEVESEEEEEDGAAEESKGNKWVEDAPEDEEEEEEDDPFAMMSGMGAEEVYKETLTIAGKEGAQIEVESEEEGEDGAVEEDKAPRSRLRVRRKRKM